MIQESDATEFMGAIDHLLEFLVRRPCIRWTNSLIDSDQVHMYSTTSAIRTQSRTDIRIFETRNNKDGVLVVTLLPRVFPGH